MIVKDVTRQDLAHSLRSANGRFGDNVYHAVCQALNNSGTRWRVLLGIHSKDAPGHKITVGTYRKSHRQCFPCWHVYLQYLAALPHGTKVTSKMGTTICDGYATEWQDINTSGLFNPVYESERCECNS